MTQTPPNDPFEQQVARALSADEESLSAAKARVWNTVLDAAQRTDTEVKGDEIMLTTLPGRSLRTAPVTTVAGLVAILIALLAALYLFSPKPPTSVTGLQAASATPTPPPLFTATPVPGELPLNRVQTLYLAPDTSQTYTIGVPSDKLIYAIVQSDSFSLLIEYADSKSGAKSQKIGNEGADIKNVGLTTTLHVLLQPGAGSTITYTISSGLAGIGGTYRLAIYEVPVENYTPKDSTRLLWDILSSDVPYRAYRVTMTDYSRIGGSAAVFANEDVNLTMLSEPILPAGKAPSWAWYETPNARQYLGCPASSMPVDRTICFDEDSGNGTNPVLNQVDLKKGDSYLFLVGFNKLTTTLPETLKETRYTISISDGLYRGDTGIMMYNDAGDLFNTIYSWNLEAGSVSTQSTYNYRAKQSGYVVLRMASQETNPLLNVATNSLPSYTDSVRSQETLYNHLWKDQIIVLPVVQNESVSAAVHAENVTSAGQYQFLAAFNEGKPNVSLFAKGADALHSGIISKDQPIAIFTFATPDDFASPLTISVASIDKPYRLAVVDTSEINSPGYTLAEGQGCKTFKTAETGFIGQGCYVSASDQNITILPNFRPIPKHTYAIVVMPEQIDGTGSFSLQVEATNP